ncbi:hypothetical protein QBC36DRAFT_46740 [Triangularia setosa]|uniref:Uncharacterized protein n=1 Tax=Triangularia setosa TaxID=2587417 RepID=A0AAN6WEE6_9PEZI|nr:hypothetical protein QBC36DRAFT_46740 [Podospora setosa]
MDHHRIRETEENNSSHSNQTQNTEVFANPSIRAGDYYTYVDRNLNHHHQQYRYLAGQRLQSVPHLTFSPSPAIGNHCINHSGTPGANFTMGRQHALSAGDSPPSLPEHTGATAPLQAVVATTSANSMPPPHESSDVTSWKKHTLPDKVMIQVKGKWFVALVINKPHSIMDHDFAQKFLELRVMPIPTCQLEEIAAITDGHSSGPREFVTFDAQIPSLELNSNWKTTVALLHDTWKFQSAPLLLGQSFFERLAKEHGPASHRAQ